MSPRKTMAATKRLKDLAAQAAAPLFELTGELESLADEADALELERFQVEHAPASDAELQARIEGSVDRRAEDFRDKDLKFFIEDAEAPGGDRLHFNLFEHTNPASREREPNQGALCFFFGADIKAAMLAHLENTPREGGLPETERVAKLKDLDQQIAGHRAEIQAVADAARKAGYAVEFDSEPVPTGETAAKVIRPEPQQFSSEKEAPVVIPGTYTPGIV